MSAISKGVHWLGTYFRDVVVETKKARWPNRKDMLSYTVTVVAICVVMFVLTYAFDLLVTEGFKAIGIGS